MFNETVLYRLAWVGRNTMSATSTEGVNVRTDMIASSVENGHVILSESAKPTACSIAKMCIDRNATFSNSFPWGDREPSFLKFLASASSFSDNKGAVVDPLFFPPEYTLAFVGEVISGAKKQRRPLFVDEIFDTALNVSENNILGAFCLMHSTRTIARNMDTKLDPRFDFSVEQMRAWKRSLALIPGDTDAVGGFYHMSGVATLRLLSHLNDSLYRPASKAVARVSPMFSAGVAKLRLMMDKPEAHSHTASDNYGLELSGGLINLLKNKPRRRRSL